MKPVSLAPGEATGIGSLPGTDHTAAIDLVLDRTPGLPAAPSLPLAAPAEYLLAGAAIGMHGVEVRPDGSLAVDPSKVDPFEPVSDPMPLDAHRSFLGFLDAMADRQDPIKFQLGGPVTLGMALWRAGVDPGRAFAAAGGAVRVRAAAMVAAAMERAPLAPQYVFVDDPGLVAVMSDDFPLAADDTIDVISGVLAVIEPHAVTGLHCCGTTDWRLVQQAGPQVLSMPVDVAVEAHAGTIATHLERGGWIAWGAVPTDGPVSTKVERHWNRLGEVWCQLVASGCDAVLLRERSIVTPACGLAHHTAAQADDMLRLAAELGRRIQMQSLGLRLTVGA
ncbi:MAG TPA: hypothetical protein VMW08_04455 [Acidimicrobiales bacterium]|nr:hypothetical protein [Acidimicrobiales bacterium]